MKGLFIFHRDYRIQDNIGLIQSAKECDKLYCCFIFTPEQVTNINEYRSVNAIQFMIESLEELSSEIEKRGGELLFLYGNTEKIIEQLIQKLEINCIYFNKDYTPYAIERDTKIKQITQKLNIECKTYSDYYLYEPGSIKTIQQTCFKKFTPFYNKVIDLHVDIPINIRKYPFCKVKTLLDNKITLKDAFTRFTKTNNNILVNGGRRRALILLKKAIVSQNDYNTQRDYLMYNTTHLSAYIKFGCISIREVYYAFLQKFGRKTGLIRELIWRDFFAHVLYCFPEVIGKSYIEKYRKIKWRKNYHDFELWKTGKTGVPIIDAGMRELNTTGYMHNRVRMMVANFLVKTLLIDWRWGEKYFAEKLTDYDIASNNGNWQSISSTGVDMKPYYRDMNPYIQTYKFDSEAKYIKKWIPELKDVPAKDIHNWEVVATLPENKYIDYPKPMVNYKEQKTKMLKMYQTIVNY